MSAARNQGRQGQEGPYRDLAIRAGSAVIFAGIAITLTVISPWSFAAMIALGALVLAWEWQNLTRKGDGKAILLIHTLSALAACGATSYGQPLYAMGALIAGAIIAALIPQARSSRAWAAFGILYLGVAFVIMIALRNDDAYGLWAILLLFIVVWSSDMAAYFTGRTFGGPKLAPAISPGKTWSGFAGGLVIPVVLTFFYATFLSFENPYILSLVGILLAVASQLGDLIESAIKRNFGAKDSGSLLPGHGGLFDRVDGLIGTAIAAGILVVYRSGSLSPRELLMWN